MLRRCAAAVQIGREFHGGHSICAIPAHCAKLTADKRCTAPVHDPSTWPRQWNWL
jgi:hypothetical protein